MNATEGDPGGVVQVCAQITGNSAATVISAPILVTLAINENSPGMKPMATSMMSVSNTATFPVSAVAGSDFDSSVTLEFAKGAKHGDISCINISITDDNALEEEESFVVSLDSITGNHALGNTTETIVTIIDDDSEWF